MTTATLKKLVSTQPKVGGELYRSLMAHVPPVEIKDKRQHRLYASVASELAKKLSGGDISARERAAIRPYFSAVAHFVDEYERRAFPLDDPTPAEMLASLMGEHDLNQSDLSKELGSQSVVSEVLSGKRELNAGQIVRLARRFHVSPMVFLPR